MQILCVLLEKLEKEEVELVAIISRKLWLRINTMVFGGDFPHPS
jgi:hypothetical protein